MSLVERLGYKSLKELYSTLDNNDIMEWAAYDMTQNDDWRKKYKEQIEEERQRNLTREEALEEEGRKIKELLMRINR